MRRTGGEGVRRVDGDNHRVDACLSDEALAAYADAPTDATAEERAHLASCAACSALVEEPRELEVPRVGDRLGRYVLHRLLGAGSMGVVYEAYDTVLQRAVALKLIADALATRVVLEARAMATITHPNLVDVYDAGTIGPHVFIAMELVAGRSLHAWLQQPSASVTTLLSLLDDAAAALAALHSRGVVHGDVKPSNMIVGDDGRLRLTDLGLSRTMHGGARAGFAGTWAYAAPETKRGEPATTASDQFAFFTTVREAIDRLPRAPRSLRHVIARGTRERAAERYASMADARRSLQRSRWRDRMWRRAGGLALAGLVLTAAALATAELSRCPSRAKDRTFAEARAAMLGSVPPGAGWTTLATRVDVLIADAAAASCELDADPCTQRLEGELLATLRFAADEALTASAAVSLLSRTLPVSSCRVDAVSFGPPSEQRARGLAALRAGRLELGRGLIEPLSDPESRLAVAEAHSLAGDHELSVAIADDVARSASPALATRAHVASLRALLRARRLSAAAALAQRLEQEAETQNVGALTRGRALLVCGEAFALAGDHPRALATIERALVSFRAALGVHRYVADALVAKADVHSAMGDVGSYAAATREAGAILEAVVGPDHPALASIYENLAHEREVLGDFEEARLLYARALAAIRTVPKPLLADEARVLYNSAMTSFELGDTAEAFARLDTAERLYRELGADEDIADVCEHAAELHFASGDDAAARRALLDAADTANTRALRLLLDARAGKRIAPNDADEEVDDIASARASLAKAIATTGEVCARHLRAARLRYERVRNIPRAERAIAARTSCRAPR